MLLMSNIYRKVHLSLTSYNSLKRSLNASAVTLLCRILHAASRRDDEDHKSKLNSFGNCLTGYDQNTFDFLLLLFRDKKT